MIKGIKKRDILGGKIRVPKAKDGGPDAFKGKKYNTMGDIKKFGLIPVESIKITNPITGEKKWVTLRRDGTTESKVIEVLANAKSTREQKDSIISMYLFERGKESASMMMDLWMYKGQHTKESRNFHAQMRHDVDIIAETLVMFMRDTSSKILDGLHFEIRTVKDPDTKKDKQIIHRLAKSVQAIEIAEVIETLGQMAFYFSQTAELITLKMTEERERRMKEKGYGIYVNPKGGVYSIYQDGDIVAEVERDRKQALEDKEKEHDGH